MVDILRSLRPRQWIKNFLIFAPIFFAQKLMDIDSFILGIIAFISFVCISSSIYLVNDLFDMEKDKLHPQKKLRPIASGNVSIAEAVITLVVLSIASFLIAIIFLPTQFLYILVIYFSMQFVYTILLKHLVLLDVFIVSIGFVLRILAGGYAIQVQVSSWILLCTLLGALFLSLSKRKNELVVLYSGAADHRETLNEYSVELLNQLICIVAGATILAYALYTQDHDTILKFGTDDLMYTIPFVVYGVFRYLYLSSIKCEGGDPTEVFIKDKPMLINVILFITIVFFILY